MGIQILFCDGDIVSFCVHILHGNKLLITHGRGYARAYNLSDIGEIFRVVCLCKRLELFAHIVALIHTFYSDSFFFPYSFIELVYKGFHCLAVDAGHGVPVFNLHLPVGRRGCLFVLLSPARSQKGNCHCRSKSETD